LTRLGAVAAGAVAAAAAVVEFARTGSGLEAVEALVAAVAAVAVAALALTLPGVRPAGLAVGGVFVVAGVFTWTFADRPIVIWTVLGAGGVLFLWMTRGRWPAGLRALAGLAGAWLGLAYWLLGAVGAALVAHGTVAAQRAVYIGVFMAAALAVVAAVTRRAHDLTVGIAAAILLALAALLLAGAGSMFDAVHAIPDSSSARDMRDRFWGGSGLYYHPNSTAGLAVVAAIRILPDRAFGPWHRYGAGAVACAVLVVSDSRTGFVLAVAAALVHAVLVLGRWSTDLPPYRRRWVAVGAPLAALALVLALSGGAGFLLRNRFGDGAGVSSGRVDTWRQVATDWRDAGPVEKLLGDAGTARAVVIRANDGAPPEGPRRKLNTDNAAVGALRRGGVLGLLAFLVGLVLLLRHAVPPRAAWFTIAAVAMVPAIATEDWLLGGTNGVIWIILLAGEAHGMWAGRPAKWMAPVDT
jgi:hypothetical protein